MKIILYTGLGFVVLCVGFVLIIPGLMDWNQYKSQISDRVAYELGREFAVSGDISLSLIPETKFSLNGVHIGSIEGASVPSMAQVKSVDVEVALIPLLMGSIQIVRVILVEPTIILERLSDGRRNWVWAESQSAEPQLLLGKFLRDVSLEEFVISSGNFEYVDVSGGHRYQIEDANLRLSAPSLSGPFQFRGVLRAFGAEVVVDSISVEIDSQNNILTRGDISSQGLQLKYLASSKTTTDGVSSWEGSVKVYPNEGNGLPIGWDSVREVLLGPNYMDPELAHLTSDFTWQEGGFDLSQLEFRVGELKGAAAISIGPNRVSGRVDLGHLNLDKVLNSEIFVEDGKLAVKMVPKITGLLSSLSNRPDLLADVVLVANLIQYKGQAIRDVVVDGAIRDGVMRLNQGSASLPGASSIALEGQFYLDQNTPGFLGAAEGGSDNLRTLLKWLSIELSPSSGERLRRLLFSTKIQGTLASGNLTDIDLQFDTSQIRGGIAYVVSNGRPGLGIGLHVDQLDLDAYFPQVSEHESAISLDSRSYRKILSAFDADFDVRLDEVTVNGIPISGVILNGLWQQDGLDVREIVIQEFLGSSIKFTGALTEFSSNPTIQGSFSGAAKKLSSLARVVPEINELPKYLLGPIEVEVAVQGDIEQITMDGFVEVLESKIGLRGSIVNVLKNGKADVSVEVEVASLSEFGDLLSNYGVIVPGVVLGTDIPLTLEVGVAGGIPNFDVGVVVMAAGGRLEAEGTLVPIAQTVEFDLHGDFTHANIGEFMEIFAREPMPDFLKVGPETAVDFSLKGEPTKFIWEGNVATGDLQIGSFGSYYAGENDMSLVLKHPDISVFISELGVDESSILSGGPIDLSLILQSGLAGIKVPEFEVSTPASDLHGSLALQTVGGKKKVLGTFTSGNLDLDELAALAAGISSGKVEASADPEGEATRSELVAPGPDGDGLVSWEGLAVDFILEAADVRGLGQKFENVDAKLNITSRSINIEYFKGLWGDGNFSAKGILASELIPTFDVTILLENADLTQVLASYGGIGPISGRVTLEASLAGQGKNMEQRLASLSGGGHVTGTAGGTIGGISLNEFVEQSRGLEQADAFLDLVPTIWGGGQTLFAGFSGNFEAEKGKVKTEDLVIMLDKGEATVSGLIDLGTWTQDLEVETILTDYDFSLPLQLYITGDVAAPDVGVRVPELKDYLSSVFSEVQSAPDEIRGIVQGAENSGLEQILEGNSSIGAAEDLIERLIDLDSSQQSGATEDKPVPKQPEDTEFRDLLQQLLQD